jgi:hypothetical protein
MKWTDSRVILFSILSCAICLAYFQTLDLMGFSTSNFRPIFRYLLAVDDSHTCWFVAAISIAAACWRFPGPVLRMVDACAMHPLRVASATVVMLALGAVFIYQRYPLAMDEYAAVFQSRIFAHGRIVALLPPSVVDWLVMPSFNGAFLIASRESGRTISQYWPGFALLLAPFQLLSVPWLCNPLLAGLAIYLMYSITLEITGDRRSAAWAMLFGLASSAFIANAISFYSMQAHLTLNLLFVRLLLKPTASRAFAAGAVGSLALVLHNPVPHTLFAIPWILALVLCPEQRRSFVALIAGYLPGIIVLGYGWLYLRTTITGEASAAYVMSGTANGVLTIPDLAVINMRIAGLAKMCVWAVPGLYVLALAGRLEHGRERAVRLLSHSAVVTFCGYLLVVLDQGHGWGYRYFHSAFGAVPILAGCAMTGKAESHSRLVTFAGATAALSLLVLIPIQMTQIHGFIAGHLAQIPSPLTPGNHVYFLQPGGPGYLADMAQIDPFLRDPDLLLSSRGRSSDAELIRQNWPYAVKVHGVPWWVDEWYLGPQEQRRSTPGTSDVPHFIISFAPGKRPP